MSPSQRIRVAFYGCGTFANRTRLPNVLQTDAAAVVAVCDQNAQAAQETAERFNVPNVYRDAHEMIDTEDLDVLYSLVPAYVRTDVEATAAERGIHIFSEKPQALTMQVAHRIDGAIREAGVISTVGFRERYRPIFQKARELLSDKTVVHVRFQSFGGLPPSTAGGPKSWWHEMEKSGGRALDWGVHATDYTRFMTGLNVKQVQAFYCERPAYATALSASFNYCMENGATMTLNFVSAGQGPKDEPRFTIFYEGGCLEVHGYEQIRVNGASVYEADPFDPWLEQDRTFIGAVQSADRTRLLSDYHDGLFSLAPILAGWESARQGGVCMDLERFMAET